MRLLLTSSGTKNSSIQDALVDLLGKPIADSNALFVPTGIYPFPGGGRPTVTFTEPWSRDRDWDSSTSR